MRIIVLTPEWDYAGETDVIKALFENGLKRLHLRKPNYNKQELKDYLKTIPGKYRPRIIIHSIDNKELVKPLGLAGIHINSDERLGPYRDMLKLSFLKLLSSDIKITTTYRTQKNLRKAGPLYDYIILNNVFKSRSKEKYKQYHDWTEIENTLAAHSHRVLARGGVTKQKLPEVQNLGFAGATFMEAIWNSEDPVSSFLEIKEKAEQLRARAKTGSY